MRLQTTIYNVAVECAFDIEDDMKGLQEGGHIKACELLVSHSRDSGIELLRGQLVDYINTILMLVLTLYSFRAL